MSEEISREEIAALLARGSEEMTREEAIMVLKNEQPHCGKKALFPEEKKYEAFNIAIKALEQGPCDDAISQSDVIDAIGSWMDSGENCLRGNAERYLIDRIKALPSVNPKQRTGHWVETHDGGIECSECGKWYTHPLLAKEQIKYCSNCGAKMVEPQAERE